ncbi:MAG: D-alanyl-D-alanine carboxypeptidase/D-alanyl-D-alanine-endopeptidase [Bifidobacteriaceae bacterium]|nr:D-alanyl-D-alanine carboxypeptidase/D-alanyl-D-alanine-endopeptidase [Bifidobacteriaceae bacterium]
MATHRNGASQYRNGRTRRAITVGISAVATMALLAGYAIGDAADVFPGYLTYAEQSATSQSLAAPLAAVASNSAISDMDTAKAVKKSAAKKLVKSFLKTDGLGSHVSVIVADGAGTQLASSKGSTPREPASTLKTLTAFAAATTLDMDSTLDTQVYVTESGSTSAAITLRGNGDMLLGTGASDPDHVNGRAGLTTLAQQAAMALKKKGITKVSLSYDDSLLGTKRTPDDMNPDMISSGNFTPVSSLAVDEGREWGTSEKPSDPDALLSWLPTRTTEPAAEAAQAFATKLKKAGLTVAGTVSSTTLPSSTLESSEDRIASVSSAKLWELLRFTLQQSDNTYAELFGRLVALRTGAQNSPKGATASVLALLKKHGIDTTGLHLSDCSGLSDNSKLTTKALIQVQEKYMDDSTNAAAVEGLGVSGFSGTALERAFTSKVRGLVRLKTGSLTTVTSMTGNVARTKGGMVYFAVIVNKADDMWAAHVAIDSFVSKLANL